MLSSCRSPSYCATTPLNGYDIWWNVPPDLDVLLESRSALEYVRSVLAKSKRYFQGEIESPKTTSNVHGVGNDITRVVSLPGRSEYDVALSFAGEDREYVEIVAKTLKSQNVTVFYDKFDEINYWGKDLYVYLNEVYRNKARFCVIFLSQHYANKTWTNHERKAAQARAFKGSQDYILPARFDDTDIPGVNPTTGYIDLRKYKPQEFAELIIKKLK